VLNAQDLDAAFSGKPMDVFTVKHTGRNMQTNVLARALELPIVGFLICTGAE
jgi:hypothetical protein